MICVYLLLTQSSSCTFSLISVAILALFTFLEFTGLRAFCWHCVLWFCSLRLHRVGASSYFYVERCICDSRATPSCDVRDKSGATCDPKHSWVWFCHFVGHMCSDLTREPLALISHTLTTSSGLTQRRPSLIHRLVDIYWLGTHSLVLPYCACPG